MPPARGCVCCTTAFSPAFRPASKQHDETSQALRRPIGSADLACGRMGVGEGGWTERGEDVV